LQKSDIFLVATLVAAMVAIVLVAFAPAAAAPASLTARLWSLVDSNLAIAIVSTFIAAFAGTWGAQLLAERTATRKELRSEMRGTNAALALAFTIANTYITTKKQHVRELVTLYRAQVAARQTHRQQVAAGVLPATTPFEYQLEMKTISVPFSPYRELQEILRNRISPDGKALILLTPLIQSIEGFAEIVTERNKWIEEIKALPQDADALKAALYFGTPYAPGRVDERYPNFVQGLEMRTDDCIGFAILIAQSLKAYGDRLAARYGEGAPKITAGDFSKVGDLLPDMAFYAEWMRN
jgi:hypothetical protein